MLLKDLYLDFASLKMHIRIFNLVVKLYFRSRRDIYDMTPGILFYSYRAMPLCCTKHVFTRKTSAKNIILKQIIYI